MHNQNCLKLADNQTSVDSTKPPTNFKEEVVVFFSLLRTYGILA